MDIRKYFIVKENHNQKQNLDEQENCNITSETPTKKEIINVFTDGSSINNGIKNKKHSGGIGIYVENTKEEISEKIEDKITNNICELKACIRAINFIVDKPDYKNNVINIFSDSEYVINSITKWADNWKKNNWQKYNKQKKKRTDIKNKELIINLHNLYHKYPVKFTHVKAHKSQPCHNSPEYKLWYGNYMADKLATSAANSVSFN